MGAALLVAVGTGGAGLAHAAGGLIELTPDEGAPGTEYEVAVTCAEEPTLYGTPLDDDGPPATQLPLPVAPAGPTEWTAVAVAGQYDDLYGATCGDQVEQARFDSDAPRLYLGPLPQGFEDEGRPRTEVGGTDCPDGTTASVTITFDGTTTTHTAAIDQYGDWSVPLPGPLGTKALQATASCGDVDYQALSVDAQATPTVPSQPTTPTSPTTTVPPAPASPAQAQPAQASYTG